jgi:RNA polymerase sigma-70 factor (ECF subfamily)
MKDPQPPPAAGASTSLGLVERLAAENDGLAWRQFNEAYGPYLRQFLVGQGATLDRADDVWQEVLIVALRKLPEFRHSQRKGAFRAWLKTVAIHLLRRIGDHRHEQQLNSSVAEALADPGSELSRVWEIELRKYQREKVAAQLLEWELDERFEPTTLEAFRLTALAGLTAADAARQLGLSPGAVRLARGRVLGALRRAAREEAWPA